MTFPVVGSNIPSTYQISNSLRFNDNDSPYMIWTPSSSGDNTYIWTFSTWIKRCTTASTAVGYDSIFSCYDGSNYSINIAIGNGAFSGTGDYFEITYVNSSYAVQWGVRTNALLRDNSAWYNLQVKFDTTQATANNRITLYVNGEEASVTRTNSPSQNTSYLFNTTTAHNFGRYAKDSNSWFDGYFAETHFIDGQALSPTDFGEFDEDSGIWKPKQYGGTYGTNGFYLKFNNAGNMGEDSSGNDNTFTPTNLSGTTDVTTDTPTNNFATMNPLAVTSAGTATFSEGNCQVATVVSGSMGGYSTLEIPSSGVWYCEAKITTSGVTNAYIGLVPYASNDSNSFVNSNSVFYYGDGTKYVNGSNSAYGTGWSQNDIIGIKVDADSSTVEFYLNGSSQGSISHSVANMSFNCGDTNPSVSHTFQWNFGNPVYSVSSGNSDANGYGNFEYSPSGGLALCTQNLATALSPTIDDGSAYFHTQLYTGDGTTNRSITNDANAGDFQPDFLWIKERSSTSGPRVFDSNRGAGKRLVPSDTGAESSGDETTSFDSDGFTIGGTTSGTGPVNENTQTYVAWQWKANAGSTSSNTDGSITSTVQTGGGGFSIVTFTGTGANGTFGHGLGAVPKFIIFKNRTDTSHWICYHEALGNTTGVYLNLTNANAGTSSAFFNNTTPTSSVVSVGVMNEGNGSGDNIVAYCFADIEGYSKFGSYTGNGSSDGPFVYTGFKPAFTLIKRTNATQAWVLHDSARAGYINPTDNYVYANATNVEAEDIDHDYLSNGFKIRSTFNDTNASGGTYIYMAFAQNPFVSLGAVPVTAL